MRTLGEGAACLVCADDVSAQDDGVQQPAACLILMYN